MSELCRLVLNFLQARHQLPTSGAWVRGAAHGGKSRSNIKRSRFRNGAKSVPKRRKLGDDPVGKTKVASSDEGSFQLYFAASSERVYPKKQTKTFIDWGGAADQYLRYRGQQGPAPPRAQPKKRKLKFSALARTPRGWRRYSHLRDRQHDLPSPSGSGARRILSGRSAPRGSFLVRALFREAAASSLNRSTSARNAFLTFPSAGRFVVF